MAPRETTDFSQHRVLDQFDPCELKLDHYHVEGKVIKRIFWAPMQRRRHDVLRFEVPVQQTRRMDVPHAASQLTQHVQDEL